jgi:hypothetical protein
VRGLEFNGGDLRDYSVLGFDIVSIGNYLTVFWGNVLPPSSK